MAGESGIGHKGNRDYAALAPLRFGLAATAFPSSAVASSAVSSSSLAFLPFSSFLAEGQSMLMQMSHGLRPFVRTMTRGLPQVGQTTPSYWISPRCGSGYVCGPLPLGAMQSALSHLTKRLKLRLRVTCRVPFLQLGQV